MAKTKTENNSICELNSALTREERQKKASKAGKASVAARRARKTLKEELLSLLEDGDMQEKLSLALLQKALKGDVKAFETIRDTIGEKPRDGIDLSGNIGLTEDDRNLLKEANKLYASRS